MWMHFMYLCLSSLERISSTVQLKQLEWASLFPTLWGKAFSLSSLNTMLRLGFFLDGFIRLKMFTLIPSLIKCLLLSLYQWMGDRFCQMIFLYCDNHVFSPFIFLIWCFILTNSWLLSQLCILGINPILSWCTVLFIYFWIGFSSVSLRIFASLFLKDIGL